MLLVITGNGNIGNITSNFRTLIFTKIGTDARTPKVKTSSLGPISHHPFPYFALQNPYFNPGGPENLCKY